MNENIIVAITKLNEIVTDIDKDDTCFLDIKDTVEEVIALLKAKDINVPTKWVSVKDRLPDEGETVLTVAFGTAAIKEVGEDTFASEVSRLVGYRLELAFLNNGSWIDYACGETRLRAPLYWMPIRALPKRPTRGGKTNATHD